LSTPRIHGTLGPKTDENRSGLAHRPGFNVRSILANPAVELSTTQERQLQAFAEGLLREVAAWRNRKSLQKVGVRHDA
jgi:hypothetical protein